MVDISMRCYVYPSVGVFLDFITIFKDAILSTKKNPHCPLRTAVPLSWLKIETVCCLFEKQSTPSPFKTHSWSKRTRQGRPLLLEGASDSHKLDGSLESLRSASDVLAGDLTWGE